MPPTSAPVRETAQQISDALRRRVLALLPTAVIALVAAIAMALAVAATPAAAAPARVTYRWTMNISDSFHRVLRGSFGHAHLGGAYVRHGRAWLAVARRHGQIGPITPGRSVDLTLAGVRSSDEVVRARFSLPRLATRGYGTYVMVMLRHRAGGSAYLARLRVGAGGELRVSIAKTQNGHDTYLTGEVAVRGRLHAGRSVVVEGRVTGGVPAEGTGDQSPTIGVRAWLVGHARPAWQLQATDTHAGALATGSGIGLRVYQSVGSRTGTVMVQHLLGWHGHPIHSGGSSTPPPPSSSTPPPPTSSSAPAPTSSSVPAPTSSSVPAPSSSAPAPSAPAAGAAALGTAQYTVPSGAIYVANNGNDSTGTGAIGAPFATLSRAVSAAPNGATVVLRGGSYNEDVFVGKSLTIEGYPGEVVWLDGSVPVTGWTQSGSTWVHSGWSYQFDHSASFSTGSDAGGFVNPSYPMAAYPDQVFADGAQLQQVSGTPGPGQFAVDYTNSTITVGSDPTGVAMRASNVQQALVIGGGNVTVRGLGVRRYATSLPQMGTVYLGGSVGHDLISDVVFTDNATQALSVDTAGVTVNHVTASNNGMTGIHVNAANGSTIENSVVSGNNTQHFNSNAAAAAVKVGRLDGITISNNVITDNLGVNGIWTDENVTNFVITGNTVANNNAEYGIITELSDTGIVAGNVVSSTRYGYTAFDTGNVQVYNNTFSGDSVWDIGLSQDNRYQPGMSTAGINPTTACPWIVQNVSVMNNDVTQSSALYEFYALDKQTNRSADSMNITLHGNLFRVRSTSGPWPIGWGGSDNVTVTNYSGPRPWETAHSLPVLNDGVAQTTDPVPSDMTSLLVPLPSQVATPLGVPVGTVHLGAFTSSSLPAPTSSSVPAPTSSSVPAPTSSSVPAPTSSSVPAPTSSSVPAPTSSSVPAPTSSSVPAPTSSSVSPTPSPTSSTPTTSPPSAPAAGAAALGTAQYTVPSGAIYVANNGNDSTGTGAIGAPFATLSRGISAAPTGGTVVLRGGSYNEDVFVGKSVTIEGYPGEVVWLDGSIPVTGWTQSGSTWVHSGWNYQFDHSASFSTGSDAGGFVNPNYPMAAYPDQVFANGTQLQQVSGTPGPGQFSVNYSAATITVGSDPTGVAMRASNVQQALVIGGGNVTLRGLGIRRYATSMPQMGTVYLGGSVGHDLISDVIFTDNATQGLSVDAASVMVNHVTSSNNGMTGIHANAANGSTIENSLLTGNNTQHFNAAPSAGAIKVGRLNGITISKNVITGNLGVNGIWTDENVTNFVITGNTVANNNAEYGIITELSDTGVVAGNKISGTHYGYTAFDTGNVQVYNNTFSGDSVWDIGLSQDNRYQPGMSTAGVNPTSTCPWIVQNVSVMNNDVTHSSALYEFYALDKQTNRSADSMNITLHGNLFRVRSTSGPWPIGWGGSDNVTVTNYSGPRPWEIAHSLPVLNEGVTLSTDPAPSDMNSLLVPLPSQVATPLGVPVGTLHLGAF